MFKFNFQRNDGTKNEGNITENNLIRWYESKQINPEFYKPEEVLGIQSLKCGDIKIKHLSTNEVMSILKVGCSNNSFVISAEQNHSDLVTAVYEGGLKVWECTYDLINFITENSIDFNNKKVLDLGCGAGILGILTCLKGAETTFQDYNEEVIKFVTIPNTYLNNIDLKRPKFYSGDWKSFEEKQLDENEKFDYIISSETIYNPENYKKLLSIFKKLLKISGVMYPLLYLYFLYNLHSLQFPYTSTSYLAAKYYYFGVGGGVAQFEDLLRNDDSLKFSTCWECSSGVKRCIIKITFK